MNNEEVLDKIPFGIKEEAINDIGTLTGTAGVEHGGITTDLEEVTRILVKLLSCSG